MMMMMMIRMWQYTFPKHMGDSAFNPLTVPLDWWCHQIARSICLSVHVAFFIQKADQTLFGIASRWVDGRDRTIKKIKNQTPTNREQDINPSQWMAIIKRRPNSRINSQQISRNLKSRSKGFSNYRISFRIFSSRFLCSEILFPVLVTATPYTNIKKTNLEKNLC